MKVSTLGYLLLSVLAASLTLPHPLFSQQVTASIQGSVMDPSGAPVPGVTITAKDVDRGSVLTTTTNTDGIYTLPRLPIGRYEIRAEAKGFQTAVHPPATLEMNQIARIDFTLTVGQMTQTVDVVANAPLLQTE